MTSRLQAALVAIGLVAMAACSAKKADDGDARATATVKTVAVQAADIPETLTAYGAAEVAASGEQTLTAPVEVQVAAVKVQSGAEVAAGQALIELRPSPTTASELTKAAADQDVADKAFARAQRLRASGLDSDADVEQARATDAAAAQAHRSLTERAQTGLVIRAAKAGVVEALTATPGDMVAAGASLGKLGASGAVAIRLGLEPGDVRRVHAGDVVTLRSPGAAEIGSGLVAEVQSRVDPQTRLAGVVVTAQASVAIGQQVQGDIALRSVHAPAVPKAALVYDRDQPCVFVVSGGVAHRKPVTLGSAADDKVAVVSGLSAGDRVVVEGAAALEDGMAVVEGGAMPRTGADDAKP